MLNDATGRGRKRINARGETFDVAPDLAEEVENLGEVRVASLARRDLEIGLELLAERSGLRAELVRA